MGFQMKPSGSQAVMCEMLWDIKCQFGEPAAGHFEVFMYDRKGRFSEFRIHPKSTYSKVELYTTLQPMTPARLKKRWNALAAKVAAQNKALGKGYSAC